MKQIKFLLRLILVVQFLSIDCFSAKIIAQTNSAKVYIFRKQTFGTPVRPEISINNIALGNLPNKKYMECTVPAGNVSVSMYFSLSGANEAINFVAESGKTYYIKANIQPISPNSPLANLNLSRVRDAEGEKSIKKCKEELVADVTDYITSDIPEYAYNPSETVVQPISSNNVPNNSNPIPVSDVDRNIPKSETKNSNTFVLIIANESYTFLDSVEYALNDGERFREYCIKTLGIPEQQIWMYQNASLGILYSGINKMVQALNIFDDGKAIIYYSGHGIPDEKTGDAYIIPVDGKGTDVSSCYSLNKLYNTMSSANASNVTYFMDACFTGANRDGSMLVAARGVAREPKKETIGGKTVVFSAASGDETAMAYKEKGHGLFTYYLLKILQDTKGNATYGEIADYINENVKKEAFLTNEKPQNPVVATSEEISSSWKKMTLK
ncbi:MAG: caspase family protein [Muribaculaceae bacterium]|nr:caspase family protein [Muribaculaceae bacterium]